jgi:hypothetical protein
VSINGKLVSELHPFQLFPNPKTLLVSISGNEVREEQPCHVSPIFAILGVPIAPNVVIDVHPSQACCRFVDSPKLIAGKAAREESNCHASEQSHATDTPIVVNNGNEVNPVQDSHAEFKLVAELTSISGNEVRDEQPCHALKRSRQLEKLFGKKLVNDEQLLKALLAVVTDEKSNRGIVVRETQEVNSLSINRAELVSVIGTDEREVQD